MVVIEGFGQEGPRVGTKQGLQRLPHGRVAMQGQQQGGIGVQVQQGQQATADVLEALPPVLAPMDRGQQHPLPAPIQPLHMPFGRGFRHLQQGINDRVAGGDRLPHHP